MKFVAKSAFGSLLLILGGLACAQAPSDSTASASSSMVPDSASAIKAVHPAAPNPSAEAETDIVADPATLLPDLPAVPRAKATLVGGTVERLDRVRDQVTVRVFGGGRMNILFDPRTHVYRGEADATIADLHDGERVSIDTILDGSAVFARNIRLKATQAQGESQGVVLKYRSDRGELTIRDAISPAPVRVRLDSATRCLQDGRAVPVSTLVAGSLVAVRFNYQGNGSPDVAREISVLALPGTRYTFAGQITHLDMRTGLLVIDSSTDRRTYEIYLDPSVATDENLHVGAGITVVTTFEGSRYLARGLTIDSQQK
ncbi:MAG: DUF5666 domain-containing protein [Candidatus Sulfotelmatobacter sp.]|jgi:hypothetical protein